MVYVGFHKSLASTYVFTKESRRSIYVTFKNNLAREGTYSIPKFLKFKRQMKETNEGRFLIETGFLDTRSYFLEANQNARLTAYNQPKFVWCHSRVFILSPKHSYWPMRMRVLS